MQNKAEFNPQKNIFSLRDTKEVPLGLIEDICLLE